VYAVERQAAFAHDKVLGARPIRLTATKAAQR
jgi:hypothetical protein